MQDIVLIATVIIRLQYHVVLRITMNTRNCIVFLYYIGITLQVWTSSLNKFFKTHSHVRPE